MQQSEGLKITSEKQPGRPRGSVASGRPCPLGTPPLHVRMRTRTFSEGAVAPLKPRLENTFTFFCMKVKNDQVLISAVFRAPSPVGPGKTGGMLPKHGSLCFLGCVGASVPAGTREPTASREVRHRRAWLLRHRFIREQAKEPAFVSIACSRPFRSSSGPVRRGPGPAGMGFYTWAVLLPFH